MAPKAKSLPISYTAAGGVVMSPAGDQVLLLIRPSRDEVRLPKGHVKSEEALEDAALREVTEETGYTDVEILHNLGEQLVIFVLGMRPVHRTEHYYLMRLCSPVEASRPQEDEQQFFPIWVTWEEALQHLTFETEQEWVRRAQAVRREVHNA